MSERIRVGVRLVNGNLSSAETEGTLEVSLTEEVLHLKEMIAQKFGVPVKEQTVVFRGGVLKDEEVLMDCGIHTSKEPARLVVVRTPKSDAQSGLEGGKALRFRFDISRSGDKFHIADGGKKVSYSHPAWQCVLGDTVMLRGNGKYYWEVEFSRLSTKKNTFAAVIGLVPDGEFKNTVNQPIGWAKVTGWGLVAGTGQKLHGGKTRDYAGGGIRPGDRVGIHVDTNTATLGFSVNGLYLGAAFTKLKFPARPAISCIQSQSLALQVPSKATPSSSYNDDDNDIDEPEPLNHHHQNGHKMVKGDVDGSNNSWGWEVIPSRGRTGGVRIENGSLVKSACGGWVTVVGNTTFKPGTGIHFWEVELVKLDTEKNVFGVVMGVLPERGGGASNQPVGWKKNPGLGLVLGTGELLRQSTGRVYSTPEGASPDFATGDIVAAELDTTRGTLRFLKNGRDLGPAFSGIDYAVKPALSCIQDQETMLRTHPSPEEGAGMGGARIGAGGGGGALSAAAAAAAAASMQDHDSRAFRWQIGKACSDGISTLGVGASWKTVLGNKVFHPKTGVYAWEIVLNSLELRQNTFGVVLGVVPKEYKNTQSANQPLGWKAVPGWSLVTGTGERLHQSGGLPYSRNGGFTRGDTVGVKLDTDNGMLEFFRNSKSLGVAFKGIIVPVRPGLSCIQSQRTSLISPSGGLGGINNRSERKSSSVGAASGSGGGDEGGGSDGSDHGMLMGSGIPLAFRWQKGVEKVGSTNWRTVVGDVVLAPETGVHTWEIVLERLRLDNNTFGIVVGLVPADFKADPAVNQPIGWKNIPGWSLVVGTGLLLHQTASQRYKAALAQEGSDLELDGPVFVENDVVGVCYDSNNHTLSFSRNGRDLGIAFSDVRSPVRPGVSAIGEQSFRLASHSGAKKMKIDQDNEEPLSRAQWSPSGDGDRSSPLVVPKAAGPAAAKASAAPAASSAAVLSSSSDGHVFHQRIRSKGTSWKTILASASIPPLLPGGGVFEWEVELKSINVNKNTFAVVVGVVTSDFEPRPKVNQPVGWKSARGWALVAGSGEKLHHSRGAEYTRPFLSGERIGVRFDTKKGSLEFSRDGVSLGVAFDKIRNPVYPAVSCIQSQDIRISPIAFRLPNAPKDTTKVGGWGSFTWDRVQRGSSIMEVHGGGISTYGSAWQTVVGDRVFLENTGIYSWGIALVQLELTKNTFGAVVGVVPADFKFCDANQPIGWASLPGKAIIASGKLLRGGKCCDYGNNTPFRAGDVIGVRLDTHAKTLEFFRNKAPLGVAFSGLKLPLRAAASIVHKQHITLLSPLPLPSRSTSSSSASSSSSVPTPTKVVSSLAASQSKSSNNKKQINVPSSPSSFNSGSMNHESLPARRVRKRGEDQHSNGGNVRIDVKDQRGGGRGGGGGADDSAGKEAKGASQQQQQQHDDSDEPEEMRKVRELLAGLGLMEYYDRFKIEHVTYETLKALDLNDLKEIVPKLGHRAQIRNRVKWIEATEKKQNGSGIPDSGDGDGSAGNRKGMGLEIYRRWLTTVVSGAYMSRSQVDQLVQIQKEYGLTDEEVESVMADAGTNREEIAKKLKKSEELSLAPAAGGSGGGLERKQSGGNIGSVAMEEEREEGHSDLEDEEPPDAYLCPITTDIMTDPVVAEDGKTYERSAITSWFKKSEVSPITGQRVSNRALLIPNQNLKKLILQWKEMKARAGKDRRS